MQKTKWGRRFAGVVLCLGVVCSAAAASEHAWDNIVSTVHQVADIVRRGERAETWRVARAKSELETLLHSPDQITSFLEFAYGRGLLHLDGFKDDLLYLNSRLQGADGAAVTKTLDEIGFSRFALYLSDVPKRETVLTELELERGPKGGESEDRSYALPGHDRGATIEERAWKNLEYLERDYATMAQKLDVFVKRGERDEKRVWWGHTVTVVGLAAYALYEGFEMLEIGAMKPNELIALMGGIWAANSGSFYLLWQYTGLLEWLKPKVARTEYQEVKDAWKNLMDKLPVLAARTASAAAQDKLENGNTKMDAYSMAPFEALLETKSHEATEQLFERALQYLQNGHSRLARRAFREIDSRSPQEQLRNLTVAVDKAFKAKGKLENRVFWKQFTGLVLRLTGVGIGIWAANQGVKHLAPEWLRVWAKVPTAIFAALGVNRILRFLWKPQTRERVDGYTKKEREAILNAFRELMKADPTGEVLRRLAANHSSSATQAIVNLLATDAMAEVNTGRVTLTMYRMWRDTLSHSNENGERVQYLIRKTFENHRGCLRAFVDASSGLGEALRPKAEPPVTPAPPAPPALPEPAPIPETPTAAPAVAAG